MRPETTSQSRADVWFVYDGGCPICSFAAHALQIKRTVGELHLIDARRDENHPLLKEVTRRKLDLDEGMVLIYRDGFYHGEDALQMMALLGSERGWFNRLNALLFGSRPVAKVCYPVMRTGRNALLRVLGVTKIGNLDTVPNEPVFKRVFGEKWRDLPPVMRAHYQPRANTDDCVTLRGALDIAVSPFVSVLSRLTGMLVPYSGKNIPVTVALRSHPGSPGLEFDRTFHYPHRGDVRFRSRMEVVRGNQLVEIMRFGLGWRFFCNWDGANVVLRHRGYVWRIFGVLIPLPLSLVLGRGFAEETPTSGSDFRMWTHVKHPWWGITFGYAGHFKIADVS